MHPDIYELSIRASGSGSFDPDPEMLGTRLGRIPGVTRQAGGRFTFGEADAHGQMQIDAGDPIRVRIPRAWVMERGPQVFALVFMTAEWCGGEVYDPQIDDTLKKEVVLQGMVAVRQARREQEQETTAPETPAPQVDATPGAKRPWWKRGS